MYLIYSVQNKIFFRSQNGERIAPPHLLSTDYFCNLSDVSYEDNLYYSYINTSNQLVVKNLSSQEIIYILTLNHSCNHLITKLIYCFNTLLLFYCEEISDNQFNLCFSLPLLDGYKYRLEHILCPTDKVNILHSFNCTIVEFISNTPSILYKINEDFSFTKIDDDKIFEKQSIDLNDELSAKNDEIIHLKNTIKNATSQYNDLMKVAEHYKNEAIKWRSKFNS